MTEAEISAVINLLRQVSAAEIMPRFKHLMPSDIRTKSGPLDQVTIADEQAERALAMGLSTLFPHAAVIGEEAVSKNPSLLSVLQQPGQVWVIDPIDGTANFAAGLPLFGVMLALIEQDETKAAFIHDPVCGDTAFAVKSQGAWVVNAQNTRTSLRVAAPLPVSQMASCVSWRYMPAQQRALVLSRLGQLASVADYRCAAHQYRLLAGGHIHCMVFRRLYPWDHAAGVLLHHEAGGFARHFDGSAYRPSQIDHGLLLAPDETSWHALNQDLLQ